MFHLVIGLEEKEGSLPFWGSPSLWLCQDSRGELRRLWTHVQMQVRCVHPCSVSESRQVALVPELGFLVHVGGTRYFSPLSFRSLVLGWNGWPAWGRQKTAVPWPQWLSWGPRQADPVSLVFLWGLLENSFTGNKKRCEAAAVRALLSSQGVSPQLPGASVNHRRRIVQETAEIWPEARPQWCRWGPGARSASASSLTCVKTSLLCFSQSGLVFCYL